MALIMARSITELAISSLMSNIISASHINKIRMVNIQDCHQVLSQVRIRFIRRTMATWDYTVLRHLMAILDNCSRFHYYTAAKKTGCQCFVSLNVPDTSLHPLIEKYLLTTIDRERNTFVF